MALICRKMSFAVCMALCVLFPAMVAAGGGIGEEGTGGGSAVATARVQGGLPDSLTCIEGDSGAVIRCGRPSCDAADSPCKGKDGYKCFISLCNNATTLLGTPIPPSFCQPIYINITSGEVDKSCSPEVWSCICPAIYAPMCGVDGKTYSNECEAKCAGVTIAYKGKCCDCPRPKPSDKVCGKDGNTYLSECIAKCKGVTVIPCKPPCITVPNPCSPWWLKKCCPGSYCKVVPGTKKGKCTKCLKLFTICKPNHKKEICCPPLYCKPVPGTQFGKCTKPCKKVGVVCNPKKKECCPGIYCKPIPGTKIGKCTKPCKKEGVACNLLVKKECCPGLTCYGGPVIDLTNPWGKCMKNPPPTKG